MPEGERDFSQLEGGIFVGKVITFNSKAGRGFIECEEIREAYDKDIYVHGSVLAKAGANIGDLVEFSIHISPQGLPQASSPLKVLESEGQREAAFRGRLKSFSEKTGYGFIECDETFQTYGRDVYVGAQAFHSGKVRVGHMVDFNVEVGRDGNPVAQMIYLVRDHEGRPVRDDEGGKAVGKASKGAKASKTQNAKASSKKPPATSPPASLLKPKKSIISQSKQAAAKEEIVEPSDDSEAYYGTVKSFNAKSSYGFVECEATFEEYGHDIQIPKGVASSLSAGDEVGFKIALNDDGMPVVVQIWPAYEAPPSAGGVKRKQVQGTPQDANKKKAKLEEEIAEEELEEEALEEDFVEMEEFAEEGEEALEEIVEEEVEEEEEEPGENIEGGELFEGEVISYDMGLGRGFINSEGLSATFGADVYVHRRVLAQARAKVGDVVRFAVHVNKQELPQASAPLEIVKSNGPKFEYGGIVKSFSEKSGYGFVDCPELREEYGRDVYLPGSKARGYSSGMEVFFNVDLNPEGMPVVSDIHPAKIEDRPNHRKGGSKGGGKDSRRSGGGWKVMQDARAPTGGAQRMNGSKGKSQDVKGYSASYGGYGKSGGGGALGPGGADTWGSAGWSGKGGGGGGALGPGAEAWSSGGWSGKSSKGYEKGASWDSGYGKGASWGKSDYSSGGWQGTKGAKTARPYY